MSVICGYAWKSGIGDVHTCFVTDHDDVRSEFHHCKCGATLNCHEAARQDELRKEADANFRYYNPEIEELEPRQGETP